jgi:hypothetical protein
MSLMALSTSGQILWLAVSSKRLWFFAHLVCRYALADRPQPPRRKKGLLTRGIEFQ